MQNSQGYINVKLQSQCLVLANENTYLRERLDDSVSLDEHMAVVDALAAAETRIALIQEENGRLRKEAEENVRLLAEKDRKLGDADRQLQDMKELKTMLGQMGCHDAAKNIAFMYSLYESCVMNDVSFSSYIEELLERIMAGDTNYRDMLPNHIVLSKDRQEAA